MGFSLLAFGAMMLALAVLYPDSFDPRVEALYFATLAICLPPMALMLEKIRAMQADLRARKYALKQALEQIERVSTRDELTGLVNRRHMTLLLDQEILRRARRGPAFCAVLIDVDHFKRINDAHGHAQGDAALRCFTRIASMDLPASHGLARWGGGY